MHDLIDRQAAIDAILAVTGNSSVRELYEHVQEHGLSEMWSGGVNAAIDIIIAVPSAQPDVPDTNVGDTISRQAAIDAIDTEGLDAEIRCEMCRNPMHTDRGCDGNCIYDEKLYEKIMQILYERTKPLPSAQPEMNLDEWCTDCKEYDHKRHCCPRWNRVIRQTLKDMKEEQPEIIRCKDCKYCDRGIDEDGNPFLKCLGWSYGGTQEEDFCSHAERRTDEQTD